MNIAVYLKIPPDLSGTAHLMLLAMRSNGTTPPPADDHALLQAMRDVRYLKHSFPVAYILNRRGPSLGDLQKARQELADKGLLAFTTATPAPAALAA